MRRCEADFASYFAAMRSGDAYDRGRQCQARRKTTANISAHIGMTTPTGSALWTRTAPASGRTTDSQSLIDGGINEWATDLQPQAEGVGYGGMTFGSGVVECGADD
jgi:hypothetical protein